MLLCCIDACILETASQPAISLQVVFLGLDVVVPLMTEDLLKIPKLCRLYFGLLGYMLEAFPERMAALPGAETTAYIQRRVHKSDRLSQCCCMHTCA